MLARVDARVARFSGRSTRQKEIEFLVVEALDAEAAALQTAQEWQEPEALVEQQPEPEPTEPPTKPAIDAAEDSELSEPMWTDGHAELIEDSAASEVNEPQPVTPWLDPPKQRARKVPEVAKAPRTRTSSAVIAARTPEVLRLAADGTKRSHEAIAATVGLTRSSVFNIIQRNKAT